MNYQIIHLQNKQSLKTAVMEAMSVLRPPPKLKISQWADQERRLSSEASAEPGRWYTSRANYQQGIMDSISDPSIKDIVIMAGSQIGKTEKVVFEKEPHSGLMYGFTSNYIKVKTGYNPYMINETGSVKMMELGSDGIMKMIFTNTKQETSVLTSL